nr:hypothetical protein [Nonomuraea longispora]
MIDLEGLLEPVDGLRGVAEDPAGVVGEHVDPRIPGIQVRGQPLYVVQAREVGHEVIRADRGRNGLCLVRRPSDHDDRMAHLGQLVRGSGVSVAAFRSPGGLSRRVPAATQVAR